MSNSSWIEIQGCNAGKDLGYLEAMQRFFGGADKKPKVTAPDMFQVSGTTASPPSGHEQAAQAQWLKKEVRGRPGVLASDHHPQTAAQEPDRADFAQYLRQGHVLPLGGSRRARQSRIVLLLKPQGQRAFMEWLSRHSYQLTKKGISEKLFAGKDFERQCRGSRGRHAAGANGRAPTKVIFRAVGGVRQAHQGGALMASNG